MRSAENWLQKHAQSWSLMSLLSDAGDTVGNGFPLPTPQNRVNEHYWDSWTHVRTWDLARLAACTVSSAPDYLRDLALITA